MAHLQYMPGDPRLVDQLVCELKSKGIFDQFRKDCIADVDTRPAYQNLRQRVESSVTTFLSRQCWQPDLNKNQLREKLRKHILDGNYLEQGVERIVDQVVNPKVATVFIPQVEDLVYNYLGITRKKTTKVETSNGKVEKEDLLPTDLEAVSPGSVKSNEEKEESMDTDDVKDETKMEVDDEIKEEVKEEILNPESDKDNVDTQLSSVSELTENELETVVEKSDIPLPDEIKLEDIPLPEDSPPMLESKNVDGDQIPLPDDLDLASIPMPNDEMEVKEQNFKPINSEEDDSSSDSSLRRNMSPLTPIRNYNNENSCDAQQGFDIDSDDAKKLDEKDTSSFRFNIDSKSSKSSPDVKTEVDKKDPEQANLSYQFNNQVNIQQSNNFPTPTFDDSSNSHNLQIDYESDANSKLNNPEIKQEVKSEEKNQEEVKKEVKTEEKKSHKSSHRSRDSHRHSSSSSKDRSSRKSDSKYSSSKDKESKDRKSSRDESSKKSSHRERSKDRSDKKDSRDSSKHSSSHRSSSHKDSKSHRSSSSSQHKSSRHSDEKKSSSSSSSREKSSKTDKSLDRSSKDYKSSRDSSSKSHKSDRDRDRKSSSSKSKSDDKEKEKKEKKETDDHYRLSGRGSHSRRSTDRDSNDGSSSSKGSNNQTNSKTSESKRENKSSSKSENTSTTSSDNTSPSDKEIKLNEANNDKTNLQTKPIVRIDTHLELPRATPPRLPFVPDVTIKKPKFAANMKEARQLIKMRRFLDDEQKRMNQEAALLLEFQANVRPSLSQVYSNIPGPEMEFACGNNPTETEDTKEFVQDKKAKSDLQESIENIQNHIMENDGEVDTNTTEHVNKGPQRNAFVPQNAESLQEMLSQETSSGKVEELDKLEPEEIKCIEMLPDKIVYIPETIEQEIVKEDQKQEFEITIITEELSESEENNPTKDEIQITKTNETFKHPDENPLNFFPEHETKTAELELKKYSDFLKRFIDKTALDPKIYLINCNHYQENIIKEASKEYGDYEIVNIHQNGYLKHKKNVIKNLNISTEVTLPVEKEKAQDIIFSPVKSECSFELSSDYDTKLEEMVKKTSRKEIMEIILGGGLPDEMQIEMPTADYSIESEDVSMKRKIAEVDCGDNNNQHILTPNKIRKLSNSDQISSTTEEDDQTASNKPPIKVIRSKYLGKAKRVGLPRPKKTNLPNSPSSDKSVENYEQNTQSPSTPNGKLKQRNKVQRYDTSDLYKPKLHFLSRRNNISSQN